MSNLPTIYFARMDVAPEGRTDFAQWYATKHAPDVLKVGFYSAQAYYAELGSPLVCNVYEITDSELFYTDEYLHMRGPENDPERAFILLHVTNRSNTTYDQVLTTGIELPTHEWDTGTRVGGVRAPVLTTLRFDLGQDQGGSLSAWLEAEEFERLHSVRGFAGARLCRRAGRPHSANPSTEIPPWVLVCEWDDLASARSQGDADAVTDRLSSSGVEMSEVLYDRVERVYPT